MSATRHCWKCGTEWSFSRPPGRNETCEKCGADLKVCLNCASYDKGVAYQCRDRRAEEIADKDKANFCEYFEMHTRKFVVVQDRYAREDKARADLRKLLGE